ncbi:hypothetical protein A2U01_0031083, partial [Trifolium medium]|nr:hypothetical protein [Trifolium medium]
NKGETGTDFVIQNDQDTAKTSKEVEALEKDLNLAKKRFEILFDFSSLSIYIEVSLYT